MSERDPRAQNERAQAIALLVSASDDGSDPGRAARRETVVELTVAVASELGLDDTDARDYATIAALGIDTVGAGIQDQDKVLTAAERARLCEAPAACAALAARLAATRDLADALRAYRERWDGTGYPDGLKGEQIPSLARAFAVADAWVALRSPRPFRAALSDAEAAEVVRRNSGSQFCPLSAEALLGLVEEEDTAPAAEPALSPAASTPTPQPFDAHPAHPPRAARRSRRTASRRTPLAAQLAVGAAGIVVGLLLALPPKDVHDRCPPSGEGLVQCQLQKSVLPAVTIVLGCLIGALILFWLITRGIPNANVWWSSGGRRPRRDIDVAADPVLLAANWGLTYRDAHPEARVRRGRSWRVAAS
jgi:hypothetical protein